MIEGWKKLETALSSPWRVGGLNLGASSPVLMGILNLTPDSFFDGGKYNTFDTALKRAETMVKEGADIIDVGGESTRPGSLKIGTQDELERVVPLIEKLKNAVGVPISVDTTKAKVAIEAVKAGAGIINDISGLSADGSMLETAGLGASYILGHIQGTPQTMQQNPSYKNVLEEVESFLLEKAGLLMARGVDMDKIALDPGIGFGKSVDHNYQLIDGINVLAKNKFPLVVGISRKSFMGKTAGLENSDRLIPTVVLGVLSLLKGAAVLRVHDVAEAKESLLALSRALQK